MINLQSSWQPGKFQPLKFPTCKIPTCNLRFVPGALLSNVVSRNFKGAWGEGVGAF
jgi:hypothetical protein